MMGFGWTLILIVVVLLVSGALFPNKETPTSHRAALRESSLDIAERRYAQGEISRDEFESIKHGLA